MEKNFRHAITFIIPTLLNTAAFYIPIPLGFAVVACPVT